MVNPEGVEPPSLEDEIFAVAGEVETVDRPPRLPLRVDPPKLPPGRDLWPAVAGAGTFLFVDLVVMWAPLMNSVRATMVPQMVVLLLVAFGVGGLLRWRVGGAWRPFGLGMMAAWVFLTLVSVGFLTGLGPLIP
ncbi:hypothetical protein [Actinomadura atramentaria]|uniref:hypothetical protein n=1 Tax=Actinomadura atramentaria TaxID=1990 RepID=UPI00035F4985|nr:hypothetical protein [Actinomadura atramentaria]